MDYAIYTFGSGEILWKIFNGIAILMKSDSEYFGPIVKLSLGIGTFWAMMRGIFKFNFGIFGRDWFVPTYLALMLLFVPRASVNIIDVVDDVHHYSKVDNVPIGLALVASYPSKLFYHITVMVEDVMANPNAPDTLRYTKTGPMFAAQLINASKFLRITDPTLRKNIKDFTRQCYQLPYLETNIDPGALAAQNAPSILEFIAANPHPGLGIYWRDPGGASTYLKCGDCVELVREALDIESGQGLSQLGKMLTPFGSSPNEEEYHLETYLKDAWQEIAKESGNAYDIVGQQMMINATLEGMDDKRDSLNMPRRHPELTSYSATRAWEGQTQGFLINGALAARHLPTIQGVMLGLLIMMFAFVVPMSLIPGGMSVLGSWVKMMFWISSWPLFFAMLNALGTMWLVRSMGEGALSMVTQSGLADSAFDAYAIVQGLSWGVPMLSWALINRGGYALVQSISGLTANLGQSMGQSIADNTQSFDNQSMHNINAMSYSVAQQQLSPSMVSGSIMDDGHMRTVTDGMGGVTGTEHASNFRDNFTLNDTATKQVSQSMATETAKQQSLTTEAQQSWNKSTQSASDVIEGWGQDTRYADNISMDERKSIDASMRRYQSASQRIAEQENLSNDSSASGSVGVSIGVPAFLKSVVPIDASMGLTTSTSASDSSLLQKMREHGFTDEDSQNVSKGLSAVMGGSVSFGNDSSQRSSESLRQSMDHLEGASDRFNASYSQSERLSELNQSLQSSGGGLSSNLNDRILQGVADHRHGGDLNRAMRWKAKNPEQWIEEGNRYVSGWISNTLGGSESLSSMTPESLKKSFNSHCDSIKGNPPTSLAANGGVPTRQDLFTREGVSSSFTSSSPSSAYLGGGSSGENSPAGNSGIFGSDSLSKRPPSFFKNADVSRVEKVRESKGIGSQFKETFQSKVEGLKEKTSTQMAAPNTPQINPERIQPKNTQQMQKLLDQRFEHRKTRSKITRAAKGD